MDHKIVDQPDLIDYLVAFGRVLQNLVAFSAHYLNTPVDYSNRLIDKTFSSHQEYTIATSLPAPARGTKNRPAHEPVYFCATNGVLFFPLGAKTAKNATNGKY